MRITTDTHILPPDPRDRVRDAYHELECQDRPGSPWEVPFDPRPSRTAFWIRTTVQAAVLILFTTVIWRALT